MPVILFEGEVALRGVEQFHRFAEPAFPAETPVERRMIVDVLAIVDSRAFGLVDSAVDFFGRGPLVAHDVAPILPPQQGARVTQIGDRM